MAHENKFLASGRHGRAAAELGQPAIVIIDLDHYRWAEFNLPSLELAGESHYSTPALLQPVYAQ